MRLKIENILSLLPGGLRAASVYIENGFITAIDEAPEGFVPDRIIQGENRLLIPGLVNAHTHGYMTVLRNCADDLAFADWLFGRIEPMENRMTAEDHYWGALLGCMEMIACGTTAFLDMPIFAESSAKAAVDAGIRTVIARGLTGGASDPAGGERRLRETFAAKAHWGTHPGVGFMLGPHAPYSCDEAYLKQIAELARSESMGIHIHLAESFSELTMVREQYGCTPIELADRCGLLGPNTVAAHCVHLTENDVALLADRRVTVVTNPVSNLKLANGIAPVPALVKAGVNVALGTDGSSSNNALNMFRDLGALALLHKGVSGDPTCISARQALDMATVNGAAALSLNAGEISVGKAADLAILRLDLPHMQPVTDAVSSLVYSANGSEVETVVCRGEIVYDNGVYPAIDTERVYYEVNRIYQRICE